MTDRERLIEAMERNMFLWDREPGCLPPPWADVPPEIKSQYRTRATAALDAAIPVLDADNARLRADNERLRAALDRMVSNT